MYKFLGFLLGRTWEVSLQVKGQALLVSWENYPLVKSKYLNMQCIVFSRVINKIIPTLATWV